MHLIFEVTYKCPAKCPQCPIRKREDTVDLETFKNVLETFKELPSSRYLLTISGGEPTVLDLKPYVCAAKKLGYRVTVVTNGYKPSRILEAKPDAVQISVDYFGEKHDAHRGIALWNNICVLVDCIRRGELEGFLRVTLMRDNLEDLKKLYEFADGIPILAMPIKGNPEKEPTTEQIEEAKKYAVLPKSCPVGKGQFVVTPNLDVLDCLFTRNYIGNLKDGIESILERFSTLEPYPCI